MGSNKKQLASGQRNPPDKPQGEIDAAPDTLLGRIDRERLPPTADNDESSVDSKEQVRESRTHWSVVLRAANGPITDDAKSALNQLCVTYWQTLYRVARKRGQGDEAAVASVNDFICDLLDGTRTLELADSKRGSFRSFLWTCFNRFLIDEFRATTRQKVGGEMKRHSIDLRGVDGRLLLEPVDDLTPEAAYQKSMALDTFQDALDELRTIWTNKGRVEKFEYLQEYLVEDLKGSKARTLSDKLGITDNRARGLVAELRREFRRTLRQKVAQTMLHPTESAVDEEMEWLWQGLNL